MENIIVEVGLLLDKDLEYYQEILEKAGAEFVFECETHDKYWTNKNFDELVNLTENQIKNSCVRLRDSVGVSNYGKSGGNAEVRFENYQIFGKEKVLKVKSKKKQSIIEKIEQSGWYLIFDTFKRDYQYKIGDMKSRIQLQEIDNIGLLLYYDNPDYYNMNEELQRKSLIDELNSYGFDFNYNELGVDKLKTLLTGTTCVSKNQNG